jgi:hypothetical protein
MIGFIEHSFTITRNHEYLYLWLYSLVDLGVFFSFLIYTKSVGIHGRGITTYTQSNTNTE